MSPDWLGKVTNCRAVVTLPLAKPAKLKFTAELGHRHQSRAAAKGVPFTCKWCRYGEHPLSCQAASTKIMDCMFVAGLGSRPSKSGVHRTTSESEGERGTTERPPWISYFPQPQHHVEEHCRAFVAARAGGPLALALLAVDGKFLEGARVAACTLMCCQFP